MSRKALLALALFLAQVADVITDQMHVQHTFQGTCAGQETTNYETDDCAPPPNPEGDDTPHEEKPRSRRSRQNLLSAAILVLLPSLTAPLPQAPGLRKRPIAERPGVPWAILSGRVR